MCEVKGGISRCYGKVEMSPLSKVEMSPFAEAGGGRFERGRFGDERGGGGAATGSRGRAKSRSIREWCADAQPLSRIGKSRPSAHDLSLLRQGPSRSAARTAAPVAPPPALTKEKESIDMGRLEGRIAIVWPDLAQLHRREPRHPVVGRGRQFDRAHRLAQPEARSGGACERVDRTQRQDGRRADRRADLH